MRFVLVLAILFSGASARCEDAARDQSIDLLTENYLFSRDFDYFGFGVGRGTVIGEDYSQYSLTITFQGKQFLTDSVYLIWNPLPMGVGYLADKEDGSWATAEWSVGGWDTSTGILWTPTFIGKKIWKVDSRSAYYGMVNWGCVLPIGARRWTWQAGVLWGPRVRLSDSVVVGNYLGFSTSNVMLFSSLEEESDLPPHLRKPVRNFGFNFDLDWQPFKRWIFTPSLAYYYVTPLEYFSQSVHISTLYVF